MKTTPMSIYAWTASLHAHRLGGITQMAALRPEDATVCRPMASNKSPPEWSSGLVEKMKQPTHLLLIRLHHEEDLQKKRGADHLPPCNQQEASAVSISLNPPPPWRLDRSRSDTASLLKGDTGSALSSFPRHQAATAGDRLAASHQTLLGSVRGALQTSI